MGDRELNRMLVERFPELTDEYNEFIEWMGEGEGTASHCVYGDVFNPYIEQLFEEKNHKGLKKVFEFIEDVLAMNEEDSYGVMAVTVIERIECREDFEIAEEYCGKFTRAAIKYVRDFWERLYEDYEYVVVSRLNYVNVMGIITRIDYINVIKDFWYLRLEFSDLTPQFKDPFFMILGKSLLIAEENGIKDKIKLGDKVEFIAPRNYYDDISAYRPIVALSVNGEVLLEFEDGYTNFLKMKEVEI